jgi:hypothetical protein
MKKIFFIKILILSILLSCKNKNKDKKSEHLTINEIAQNNSIDSLKSGIAINATFN